ncbi:substrate-binding domain-containing protein [Pseudomonas sp. NPDC089406]|uniref:substrate-binding domain-containing protein n=1 Tax=Pseudomonas sp. NPDC089406 TaxID=3364463 RepID=UPI0038512645
MKQSTRHFFGQMAMLCTCAMPGMLPTASAADLHVLASTALKPLLENVRPAFESASGDRLVLSWGASYASAPDALPMRLSRGEKADVVLMLREALDEQLAGGYLRADTVRDIATSRIGLAVQRGVPRPDISDVAGLRRTLLGARAIAFSSGVSGQYVASALLPRLGIAEQVKPKSRVIDAPGLAGQALLSAQADVALQQMSELLAVPGIQVVGPLPDAVQRVNVIAAAVTSNAQQAQGAQALISYLRSLQTAQALKDSGFEPISSP